MYVFTLLTLDMVIDLVNHPDVYLSLYSKLTAEHVVYVQRKKSFYQLANAFRSSQTVMICLYYNISTQYS